MRILGPRIQKNGQIYSPRQVDLNFEEESEILTENSRNTWLRNLIQNLDLYKSDIWQPVTHNEWVESNEVRLDRGGMCVAGWRGRVFTTILVMNECIMYVKCCWLAFYFTSPPISNSIQRLTLVLIDNDFIIRWVQNRYWLFDLMNIGGSFWKIRVLNSKSHSLVAIRHSTGRLETVIVTWKNIHNL